MMPSWHRGVPSDRKLTSIMIQMAGDPAAVAYAAALKDAQTRVDAQRNYALAHSNLKSSQRLLKQKAHAGADQCGRGTAGRGNCAAVG